MATREINISILNGSNGFRLDGELGFDGDSGRSVSGAGDINGDGFDDVIVSAVYSYPGMEVVGRSYIIFGKSSGFSAVENLSSLNGDNGFRLTDEHVSVPYLVSDAGDVNGDGFDDVIIGGTGFYSYYTDPKFTPGAGYVVFGKASGFAASINLSDLNGSDGFEIDVGESYKVIVSSAGDVNGDGFDDVVVDANNSSYVVFGAAGFNAQLDLSGLDGSNGFRLDIDIFSSSTSSVSSAGDVNGDGFDDLIVGAPDAGSNGSRAGSSYVVFGQASGFDAVMNVSSLDGSNGFRLDGAASDDYSGISVSNAGDINGDGFDDLIIGAHGADPNGDGSGSSYVVFGKASGFDAHMNLSDLDGSNGFRLDGAAVYDFSGVSVSSAGDFNGDGFDDLIIGAPGVVSYGASYIVFGKASGFEANLDLSNMDKNDGFQINGNGRYDSFAGPVSNAGDINNDGFDDVIVGAPRTHPYGASYVIFGGNFLTGETVYRGTSGNDNLTGTIFAERFEAGDGNDSMSGLGGADIFHGDAGDDTIRVPGLDFQLVDGGTGIDTLAFTGKDLKWDLVNSRGIIDGIETVDLTGSGNNTLTLSLTDLIALSDTTNTFTIDGNGGDRVVGLNDGWEDGGIDGDYHIYTNHGTVLRIAISVVTDRPTPGVISLVNLDGNNGFRLDGAADDASGFSVSGAGDVNGDGFDDLIVGAPYAGSNGSRAGSSYVVFGRASGFGAEIALSGLDGNDGFRVIGGTPFDRLGSSVSSAGDVNGDGFDDVIIGADHADPNGRETGSSYVVFGKAGGFDATLDLASLDGDNGFRLDGAAEHDWSGSSVSSAGDINGDGFDDLIVGAPDAGSNGSRAGSSYVVFGKAGGFDATLDLASLDGDNGFRLDGAAEYDWSGSSVSSAGDINGDGFDDLIVGAPDAGSNGSRAGSSYVVFGRASGFGAEIALSGLDGNDGFRVIGGAPYDGLGSSVSNAGDVNGDGFGDVIVGAKNADLIGNYHDSAGSSYVIFGRASGFGATLDLSDLDGSNGFRLDGAARRDYSGRSVSSAGDVNGDGFDDVLVGAPGADISDRDSGSSYVVFGKAMGFAASMSLSSLDGTSGVRLDGVTADDYSGSSVSSAGDVNGDGFDDLLIGAPGTGPNGDELGASYVLFGRSDFGQGGGGGGLPEIKGTEGDDTLKGSEAAEHFIAGGGNDNLLGRGGADIFDAGAGNDVIRIGDLTFATIDGGEGNDALHLAGSGMNLDLTILGDHIHNIETICLYGRGDNTLTLDADSLLNLSDSTHTLKVHGNTGDHIALQDSGWMNGGSHGFYHTYTHDDAVLLVGANVTVEFV